MIRTRQATHTIGRPAALSTLPAPMTFTVGSHPCCLPVAAHLPTCHHASSITAPSRPLAVATLSLALPLPLASAAVLLKLPLLLPSAHVIAENLPTRHHTASLAAPPRPLAAATLSLALPLPLASADALLRPPLPLPLPLPSAHAPAPAADVPLLRSSVTDTHIRPSPVPLSA